MASSVCTSNKVNKKMAQKINPLEVYAGLDIAYPDTGVEASLHRAVCHFFNKLEAAVSHIQPRSLA
jgi:hypothetical protein